MSGSDDFPISDREMAFIRQEAMEFAGIGFFRYNFEGTVLFMDRGAIKILELELEYPDPAQVVGKNITELVVHTGPVGLLRQKVRESGRLKDFEYSLKTLKGTPKVLLHDSYLLEDPATGEHTIQVMMRDITEAKRLRTQLVQAERLSAMGKMASQLAHELNNPIFGIMNCLELLKGAVQESHQKRKYLDLAYNECKRTSGLLIKMLKFFKPDEEQKKPADVNKLLTETLLFYEKQFKNLNIRVSTDLASELPITMAVESQLKQVFINMIINANTAMPEGGELHVTSRVEPDGDTIAVTIEDTGVGISPENIDRIFEAFFTTKKEVQGVGLGLSICYGFIRDHGGNIDVQSEAGKGTIFTIYLPVVNNEDSTG